MQLWRMPTGRTKKPQASRGRLRVSGIQDNVASNPAPMPRPVAPARITKIPSPSASSAAVAPTTFASFFQSPQLTTYATIGFTPLVNVTMPLSTDRRNKSMPDAHGREVSDTPRHLGAKKTDRRSNNWASGKLSGIPAMSQVVGKISHTPSASHPAMRQMSHAVIRAIVGMTSKYAPLQRCCKTTSGEQTIPNPGCLNPKYPIQRHSPICPTNVT